MNASLNLLHRLTAATVGVESVIPETHPTVAVLGTERQGSGVVLEGGIHIVTVNYIVLGADTVTVTPSGGKPLAAKVVAQDFAAGLALLRTATPIGDGIPAVASASAEVGQEVVIVASTGGAERRVSDGILTSVAPFDANWEFSLDRALSTSAQSPGFGGAPICDLSGRVMGVSFLDGGEVAHFTLGIPIDDVLENFDELIEHGRRVSRPKRSWVGCFCYTIRNHIVIAGVMPGAPAAAAGLRAGDVLLAIDRKEIRDRRQLYTTIWAQEPGATLQLQVYRDNRLQVLAVTTVDAEEFFA